MPWSYPADIKFTGETFLMQKLCTANTGRKPTTKHDFQRVWSTSARPQPTDKTETKQRAGAEREERKNGPDKKRAGKKKGEKSGTLERQRKGRGASWRGKRKKTKVKKGEEKEKMNAGERGRTDGRKREREKKGEGYIMLAKAMLPTRELAN